MAVGLTPVRCEVFQKRLLLITVARLEKPGNPGEETAGIDAEIGEFDAGIGKVDEAILEGKGDVVAHEPAQSIASLQIEFESGAQVAIADVCSGNATAEIDERDESMASGEIIANEGAAADEVGCVGIAAGFAIGSVILPSPVKRIGPSPLNSSLCLRVFVVNPGLIFLPPFSCHRFRVLRSLPSAKSVIILSIRG
jgi:hypothetical protein